MGRSLRGGAWWKTDARGSDGAVGAGGGGDGEAEQEEALLAEKLRCRFDTELTGLIALHEPDVRGDRRGVFFRECEERAEAGTGARGGDAGGGACAGGRWRSMRRFRSRVRWWATAWPPRSQVQFMVMRLLKLDEDAGLARCGRRA